MMKIHNPLFHTDMPDPDVIRVGSVYYMVSTTMFYMPAAPILKSEDLVHWEIVSYVCSQIADHPVYRLQDGQNAYGKGQWATSLMHYKGKFYACFVCHDMQKTYLFSTDDIEKSDWDRTELDEVYHDMSFLCWEDHVYLIYGNGEIRIAELKPDFSGIVQGSDRLLMETPAEGMRLRCEGCRAYVKDGFIYLLFIDWPADTEEAAGLRREVCYRSSTLEGPYERKTILYDDGKIPGRGIAQGVIFTDPQDNWYAMMFQDSGAIGRVPFLMPVRWEDGWPVLGVDGRVPDSFECPWEEKETQAIIQSDGFSHSSNELKKVWQWNHMPDEDAWSFTERPGYLRLKNRTLAKELFAARNTLTQRTQAPYSAFSVCLECGGMQDGDFAGLCAIEERYGQIGVRQKNGRRSIVMLHRAGERTPFETAFKGGQDALREWYRLEEHEAALEADRVWLKIIFRFAAWSTGKETAEFFYSLDGINYHPLGETLSLFYSLSVFVGTRIGIFSYNEERQEGGYSDFCDFQFRQKESRFYEMDDKTEADFHNQVDFCVGTGRMGLALQQEYLEQLKLVQEEIGFRHIRGHGLFSDDMAVYQEYEDEAGAKKAEYNFTYLDLVMDSYRKYGLRPFLELGFMPEKMASGKQTVFYWKGNTTPPKSYDAWCDMVTATLKHLMDRYGADEVVQWPVEVWNEPNLPGFWKDADRKEYFTLFRKTFDAVKRLDKRFRVGGPAVCGVQDGLWIREFLDFCRKEKLAPDFITRHHYTTEIPEKAGHYGYAELSEAEAGFDNLKSTREIIDSFEEYQGLEIHITEFNTSYIPNCPLHDTNQNAAYMAQQLSRLGDVNESYSYWTFGDIFEEVGVPFTPFHGGFGLVTNGCIPKPTFWTFKFFKNLRGKCIHKSEDMMVMCSENGSYQGIAWNSSRMRSGRELELAFTLPAQEGWEYSMIRETVDEDTCNPLRLWHNMGEPSSLDKHQKKLLQDSARPFVSSERMKAENGRIRVTLGVREHGVVYFEIRPAKIESDRGYDYDRVMQY